MKNKVSILVILVSLLLISFSILAYAAPTMDGFLGIPWGATADQVDQAMKSQGFTVENIIDTVGNKRVIYHGSFAGCDNCTIEYNGPNNPDGWCIGFGTDYYQYLLKMLTQKYGSPKVTKYNEVGIHRISNDWNTTDSNHSDTVNIHLMYQSFDKNVPGGAGSNLSLWYINESLVDRLNSQKQQKAEQDL